MVAYHDKEWGVPLHHDRGLFEFLILEGAQAGLHWEMILNKREQYRKAFDNFDSVKIAAYTKRDVRRLLKDKGIVRNRLKVEGAIQNAKAFLKIKQAFGTFDRYIWQCANGDSLNERSLEREDIPTYTPRSHAMSGELKKRGFTFVGATICYAFMQAVGMVNDHEVDCFRRTEIGI
jgi:DNA-3-methyladenine glycosylase I